MRSFLIVLVACLGLAACATEDETLPPPPTEIGPAETGESCGGIAGIQCGAEGDYCRYEKKAQCGAADQMGICKTKPQMCTRDYRPVCGCDGKTYSNACTAASHGVSVVHDGKCKEE